MIGTSLWGGYERCKIMKACTEFNAKQMLTTWEADYKKKIRLVVPPLGEGEE